MKLSNSYTSLGSAFFEKINPTIVKKPKLFLWNRKLEKELRLPRELTENSDALALIFSGNRLLAGSTPIATAYAGHQFGQFTPQLGDGRAHLIGEIIDRCNNHWDIQLKGSGPTSFSRGGDGRCTLGAAVREFIMSEAIHALGIPSARSLAVTTTGEQIFRQEALPGAVVTRVASSHIRVGTFQYFAARGDWKALSRLCDYTIDRHYPELSEETTNKYPLLLEKVSERQIQLVVEWMRIGFIHGVMNTDNTAISGETIDYGPCAMMENYDPKTVFSSIDKQGRYAFGNQAIIAQWNMARFAECLLPLINNDNKNSIETIEPVIVKFVERFKKSHNKMMGHKLGLINIRHEDELLIETLLELLKKKKMDYTLTFNHLSHTFKSESVNSKPAVTTLKLELGEWIKQWQARLADQEISLEKAQGLMMQNNPVVIPRNHHIETVIQNCVETGEATAANQFLKVLRSPYKDLPQTAQYQDPSIDGGAHHQTFCGT